MYQIKIKKTIKDVIEFKVQDGEQMVDYNGDLLEVQLMEIVEEEFIDEEGNSGTNEVEQPAFDGNGDPIMIPDINKSGAELIVLVNKTEQQIANEKQSLIDEKTAEVQAQIDAYVAAQEYQKQNGGSGPVAKEEIMQIVNEHNKQFEVIVEDE